MEIRGGVVIFGGEGATAFGGFDRIARRQSFRLLRRPVKDIPAREEVEARTALCTTPQRIEHTGRDSDVRPGKEGPEWEI